MVRSKSFVLAKSPMRSKSPVRTMLIGAALVLLVGAFAAPAALADTTYPLSGSVLSYGGSGATGAGVSWGWFSPSTFLTTWNAGGTQTVGAGGAFSLPAVSAHPGNDALYAYYHPATTGLWLLEAWELDFSTLGSYTFQPAHVHVAIAHAPKGQKAADVTIGGVAGQAQTLMALQAGSGAAGALPPGFNDVVAWFSARVKGQFTSGPVRAVAEWLSPADATVDVQAGVTDPTTVSLDWDQALHAYLAGPAVRRSGPPGSVVRLRLSGWPTAAVAAFYGFSLSGPGDVVQTFSQQVQSAGPGTVYTVPLTIPATATPGEIYEIGTYRADDSFSQVRLYDYYQVATLKASAATVARGGSVRLSGRVPGSGYVELFARRSAASQPATLAAKGWTAVGRYRLHGGAFKTGAVKLSHASWFVVRYPGLKGEYFAAFTGVVGVGVR